MRRLLLLLLLVGITASAQWPQGTGHGYFKLGTWSQVSDTHFEDDGNVITGDERRFFIPGLYARVGLSDKWTATTYIPFVITSQEIQAVDGIVTQRGQSIGDINLSLERLLYKKKGFVFATDLTLGLPTGRTGIVGSGDGEFNQMVRLLFGQGFKYGQYPGYVKSNFGYNNRTNGFSNEVRWGVETGVTADKLFILARVNSIRSLKDSPYQIGGNIFGDRIERTVLGFEVNYALNKKWGLSAGHNTFLSGAYVFNAPSWTTGITLKL